MKYFIIITLLCSIPAVAAGQNRSVEAEADRYLAPYLQISSQAGTQNFRMERNASLDDPSKESPIETFTGRYAKGVNVIRVEAFGDKLLVLPLWWGGVQPLDRRGRAEFEM